MGQYRKIFLIADPSGEETAAYTRAVVLAKRSGASLTIGAFKDPGVPAAGKARLKERARELRDEGIAVQVVTGTARPPYRAVLAAILEEKPDLVIKDARQVPLLKRIIDGPSLDQELARLCPVPLLFVNPGAHILPERVIAAVDPMFGDERRAVNDRILDAALGLAIQCEAQVSIAYAFDISPMTPVGDVLQVHGAVLPKVIEQLREQHRQELFAFAKAHSVPDDRRYFLDGSPEVAIGQLAADTRADVVALGTNYHSALERLAFGSTAERLFRHLKCDVLVVKPEGFESDLLQAEPTARSAAA